MVGVGSWELIEESLELTFSPGPSCGGGERIRTGESSMLQSEYRFLRPDGTRVWVLLHLAPIRLADGSLQAFHSQKIDITERKEREAQLEHHVGDAEWLCRIRAALDEERLILYSQPIVDLSSGEIVQHELLLRMREPDGEIIAPGEFLPVAERYGLIPEIDRWVIREATRIAAEGGPTEFNLSARSIGDPLDDRRAGHRDRGDGRRPVAARGRGHRDRHDRPTWRRPRVRRSGSATSAAGWRWMTSGPASPA